MLPFQVYLFCRYIAFGCRGLICAAMALMPGDERKASGIQVCRHRFDICHKSLKSIPSEMFRVECHGMHYAFLGSAR